MAWTFGREGELCSHGSFFLVFVAIVTYSVLPIVFRSKILCSFHCRWDAAIAQVLLEVLCVHGQKFSLAQWVILNAESSQIFHQPNAFIQLCQVICRQVNMFQVV